MTGGTDRIASLEAKRGPSLPGKNAWAGTSPYAHILSPVVYPMGASCVALVYDDTIDGHIIGRAFVSGCNGVANTILTAESFDVSNGLEGVSTYLPGSNTACSWWLKDWGQYNRSQHFTLSTEEIPESLLQSFSLPVLPVTLQLAVQGYHERLALVCCRPSGSVLGSSPQDGREVSGRVKSSMTRDKTTQEDLMERPALAT